MSELKAILFDVDGTLADTERNGHRVAFNLAFEEAGLDWHWSESLYGELLAVTGGKQRMRYFLDKFYEGGSVPNNIDELIIELHAVKNAHYQRLLSEGAIPLRPGVKRLMEEAMASGIKIGIATTTTPGNVDSLLRATLGEASLDWFAVIAAGDMVPELKPAPDVFLYAMEKIGLGPENCIAVEDSRNGLKSALASELVTVVTTNGYTADDDFTGASLVVDQLGEPDSPCTVIEGESLVISMVGVPELRALLN